MLRKGNYSLFILGIFLGCSQGNPIIPPPTEKFQDVSLDRGSNHRVLWGVWEIRLDGDSLAAEVIPLRSADFTCNVTKFMQPPLKPVNMVSIAVGPNSKPSVGYFEVDVTLRHPFTGANIYKGFDVRGILMADGSIVGTHDSSVLRGGPGDTRLLNADGYTRWWNYPEFTSYNTIFGFTAGKLAPPNHPTCTVNPYKYFAHGLDKNAPVSSVDISSRGVFPTDPGVETRQYNIQFKQVGGANVFDFQYAVDASWAAPDPKYAPDYPPEAYPPEANCQEAFAISVTDNGSTAYYAGPDNFGGELKLNIEVFDWQGKNNPGGVSSEIAGLWLEGEVLGGAVDILSSAIVLPGSSEVSSVFEVTLGSLNLTHAGLEEIFITVENASPNTYKPQIPSGDNFAYPSSPLSAYFIYQAMISEGAPGEAAVVEEVCAMWGKVGEVVEDVTIYGENFDPSCSVELELDGVVSIHGENLLWVNAGELLVDFDLGGAVPGKYDVKVKNPGASDGVLPESFEVMDPEEMPNWPIIQGEPKMTGMGGLYGPCKIHDAPTWQTYFQPNPYGNPLAVFIYGDSAYLSNTGDGGPLPACAVNLKDGSIKWNQMFHSDMQNWLNVKGVSRDGEVVIVSESKYNKLYGLDSDDGSKIWETAGLIPVDAYVSIDLDGNFIVPMDNVGYASIEPHTGTINWVAAIGDPFYCTPSVGANGVIYCTEGDMWDAELHALDPASGADKWSDWPNIGSFYNGVTVHPNGTIILHGGDTMWCFTDNGSSASVKWQQPVPKTFYTSVAVGPDGSIYIIDGAGTLRRMDPETGETINYTTGWGDGVFSRPAVGADGLIYTYTRLYNENKAYFACFNPDCTLRWRYEGGGWFTDGPFGPPAIGQDGKVYSSFRKKGLVAWGD